ncbi:MAG: hypothetical protein CSA62_14300 [Planctomycetota bacterium]|nr:MAG: hypothetical protein CSA62_14300 [Planctomycetota bacterium]
MSKSHLAWALLFFASAPLPAQIDWPEQAKNFLDAWGRGRLHLLAPRPNKTPLVLPTGEEALAELSQAKGDKFYWSVEQELSFVLSGLAASTSEKALDALFAFAMVHVGNDISREWNDRKSASRQPWLIRDMAIDMLRRLQSPQIPVRARKILAKAKGRTRAFHIAIAGRLLGAHGAFEDISRFQALLSDPDPLVRAAAAKTLGELAFPEVATHLCNRLHNEKNPSVRARLLSNLVRALARSSKAEKDIDGPFAKTVIDLCQTLGRTDIPQTEQILLCELLWELRPLAALRELPKALARLQGPGDERVRHMVHALLVDMHGIGHGLKKRRGRRGTGFHASATEPKKWAEFIHGRRKLYVQRRAKKRLLPPPPKGSPKLFGMPISQEGVTLLLDASAAWSGPWWRQEKSGASGSPKGTKGTTLGKKITEGILLALANLPEKTPFRILTTETKPKRYPRKGYALISARELQKLGLFLSRLPGKGVSAPADTLFDIFGIQSGLPTLLASPPEQPSSVLWIVCSPPEAGKSASLAAIHHRIAAARASVPIPVHIAYFPDRRREARYTPYYQLAIAYGQAKRLRALAELTRGSYHWQGFPKDKK